MPTGSSAPSVVQPIDEPGDLARRMRRYFKAQVEDWYDACRHLTTWEERNLTDQCAPDRLAEHARLLDELEQVGRWLCRATQSPDFPDHPTAELVAMTLQDLKDRRALWHGSMSERSRQDVLRDVFHES